jgi:hypothetical protein
MTILEHPSVYRERLVKLADVLVDFERERAACAPPVDTFDISHWHCGTSACAVGTAATHPWFIARGFTVMSDIGGHPLHSYPSRTVPVYQDKHALDAVKAFFGLTVPQAAKLFFYDAYDFVHKSDVTPKMVAARVRELADTKYPAPPLADPMPEAVAIVNAQREEAFT